jgi:very-short-patch-repair endonuclease
MHWHDLARVQGGAISREQLLDGGLTVPRVRVLLERGDLREILPSVYAHGSAPASRTRRLWSAVLWSGGVVSHGSAAQLWRLPVVRTTTVHLTIADRRYRKVPSGLRLHRVLLPPAETTAIGGLPTTTRARTVVDVLRTAPLVQARTLLDRALQQGWLDLADLDRELRTAPGRHGCGQIRRLLADLEPGAHAESERLLHRILRHARITGWIAQYEVRLAGRTRFIDVALPELRIAIEVDGKLGHDAKSPRFEDDRRRQNQLVAAGWRVLRFTWDRLKHHPDGVIADILELMAA